MFSGVKEFFVEKWRDCNESARSIIFEVFKWFLKTVGTSPGGISKRLFRLIQVASYSIIFVFFLNIFSLFWVDSSFGGFGDFFGGMLNPIFTFLTFIGLLITIVLQRRELGLTRAELKNSSKALIDQSETLRKQRFEDTFFALFSQHNEVLKDVASVKDLANKSKIGFVLSECFSDYRGLVVARGVMVNDYNGEVSLSINSYFRVLYQLLKFIALNNPYSSISRDDFIEGRKNVVHGGEKMYSNIVRSILSSDALKLLAINCASPNFEDQYKKYRFLLDRYQFFEHVSYDEGDEVQMMFLEDCRKLYGDNCFGDNYFLKRCKLKSGG